MKRLLAIQPMGGDCVLVTVHTRGERSGSVLCDQRVAEEMMKLCAALDAAGASMRGHLRVIEGGAK